MKKILLIITSILVLVISLLLYYFWKDTTNPYAVNSFTIKSCDYTVDDQTIPKFDAVNIDFKHVFNDKTSLPVMASCLIDIDNDDVDELFFGGGESQQDVLLKYENGNFKDISNAYLPKKTGNTLGAVSYDSNQDGFEDLIITRDDTVYVLTNLNGKFESKALDVHLNKKSSPLSLTLGDFNQDGFIDMFVSGYIKKELMEGQTIFNDKTYGGSSVLLLNNGDFTFKDVTKEYGMEYIHNTFQGVFVDVNNDTFLDLVVAYDTGEPRIYLNQKGKSFLLKNNPLTGTFSYPMGIAVGDYDNNQSPDVFFSNTGTSVPKMMAKGDLNENQTLFTDWILFNNDGKGNFSSTAEQTKIAKFEFSWGAIFEDFNLDGKQDLVVAENYIAFPPQAVFKLPCRFLLQQEDGSFAATEEQAGVLNKNFAITPLSSDFNNDAYPDLVYANLNGNPKVFLSSGGDANFVKVKLKDSPKNIGAKITIKTENKTITQYNIVGEGLCSDQSNTLIFGLDKDSNILDFNVMYSDGKTRKLDSLKINSLIFID